MNERVYILLPVHNRREVTRRFVECLKVQTYKDFHLVLIDDGSIDGTSDMVRGNIGALTIISGTGDWWWAGSLQQGYQWFKKQSIPVTDFVLIINDDTEFEADFLEQGIKLLKQRMRTLLLAQAYSRQTGRLIDAGVHVDWSKLSYEQEDIPERINCLSTRGLFLRIADFFEIGGFHPTLLPHYGSDYEFTIRAHRKGMTLFTDPAVKLWFDEEATGFHTVAPDSFYARVWKIFSKRSPMNPVYGTMYIVLASPTRWMLKNIVRVWSMAVYLLFFSSVHTRSEK